MCKGIPRVIEGGRDGVKQENLVLCIGLFRSIYCPEATETRRERADIDTEKRFCLFIWETMLCDAGKHKAIILWGSYFILWFFNQMKKT